MIWTRRFRIGTHYLYIAVFSRNIYGNGYVGPAKYSSGWGTGYRGTIFKVGQFLFNAYPA